MQRPAVLAFGCLSTSVSTYTGCALFSRLLFGAQTAFKHLDSYSLELDRFAGERERGVEIENFGFSTNGSFFCFIQPSPCFRSNAKEGFLCKLVHRRQPEGIVLTMKEFQNLTSPGVSFSPSSLGSLASLLRHAKPDLSTEAMRRGLHGSLHFLACFVCSASAANVLCGKQC